ncbi:MAG: hypothetical protein V5A43_00185 [Haloarculaceae archaeon]
MDLSSRHAFVLVLAVGIAGTGIVVSLFSSAGYGTLGSAVWVLGYGITVLVLWWGWLRPLDLGHDPQDTDRGES